MHGVYLGIIITITLINIINIIIIIVIPLPTLTILWFCDYFYYCYYSSSCSLGLTFLYTPRKLTLFLFQYYSVRGPSQNNHKDLFSLAFLVLSSGTAAWWPALRQLNLTTKLKVFLLFFLFFFSTPDYLSTSSTPLLFIYFKKAFCCYQISQNMKARSYNFCLLLCPYKENNISSRFSKTSSLSGLRVVKQKWDWNTQCRRNFLTR